MRVRLSLGDERWAVAHHEVAVARAPEVPVGLARRVCVEHGRLVAFLSLISLRLKVIVSTITRAGRCAKSGTTSLLEHLSCISGDWEYDHLIPHPNSDLAALRCYIFDTCGGFHVQVQFCPSGTLPITTR